VVVDEYVTSEDGTGIVHQAPAFGDDDHRIAVANGIIRAEEMPPCPIDDAGRFTRDVYDFEGQHVKVNECSTVRGRNEKNLVILMKISPGCRQGYPKILEGEGKAHCPIHHSTSVSLLLAVGLADYMLLLYSSDTVSSGTPLLYRAIPAWFVRVQPVVDQLVANNADTRWYLS
jgi:isoleucyl-tRNA synthetase